jgi:hypothetical protein
MKYFITLAILFIHCTSTSAKSLSTKSVSGTLYSNVDVYLADGTIVNGGVEYPIYIYQEKIVVFHGKRKKFKFDKNEVVKLVFKVAKREMVFVKLKHNFKKLFEGKDDEIFVHEMFIGNKCIYNGYNIGYETKRGKSVLVNDTNLWFCKDAEEQIISLLYADTNDDDTEFMYGQNAEKYFKTKEIIGYIADSKYEKLIEYIKIFNPNKL